MTKKYNIKNTQESKNRRNNVAQDEKIGAVTSNKRGWSYIIDKIKYSGGPGDNIYVYG